MEALAQIGHRRGDGLLLSWRDLTARRGLQLAEKLNDQLNEAIECDDFDTAAILQEQIDTISAKLERNE